MAVTTESAMPEPAIESRALTIHEAMGVAIQCQKEDRLDEAELLLRKILEVAPDLANALHFSGVLAH